MAITLRRQLTEDEKLRVLEIHGRTCFGTGHPIPEGDSVHFDHIRAFADGGVSELFAGFLYQHPVEDNMATDADKREREIENNVELMNMLHDLALTAWNPKAGPNDSEQRRLIRLFRSKSIMAWSELLRDAVCGKLDLQDAEDRARPFYRELSPVDLGRVRSVVERLISWKFWKSPGADIDRVLADNKSAVKEWFRTNGLTTGYLMGASE